MPYGTNGLNSNGTLMNVNNVLSDRPSIRLLGREKGYDTGHAMAALLSDSPIVEPPPSKRVSSTPKPLSSTPPPSTHSDNHPMRASQMRQQARAHQLHHHFPLSHDSNPPRRLAQHCAKPMTTTTPSRQQQQQHHHHHHRPSYHNHPTQPYATHRTDRRNSEGNNMCHLRVGMKVRMIQRVELKSGMAVEKGAVGVVKKVPGEIEGTVAEVDILGGPLFDAWPGMVEVLEPNVSTGPHTHRAPSDTVPRTTPCKLCKKHILSEHLPKHENTCDGAVVPKLDLPVREVQRFQVCKSCQTVLAYASRFCPQCGGRQP